MNGTLVTTTVRDATRNGPMTPAAIPALIMGVVVIACATSGAPAWALQSSGVVKRPDWAGLERALAAGDYERVIAVANEIIAVPEPRPSDPEFLTRNLETARALARRGLAELRLGRLDAAEASLTKAFRTVKDQDVQRLLTLRAKKANASVAVKVVADELAWIDLLNLRSAVIVERIRHANLARGTAAEPDSEPADPEARETQVRSDVDRWVRELETLRKLTAAERKTLAESFEFGGSVVTGSPLARSLVGGFRPALLTGIAAVEVSKVPFSVQRPAKPGQPPIEGSGNDLPADERRAAWLTEANAAFAEAGKALDEAIAACSPNGEAGLRPEAKIEAALLRAELLTERGAARRQAGNLAAASEDFRTAIALQGEVAKMRKDVRAEGHPDLSWPLVLAAEVAVEEAERHVAAGAHDRARDRGREATTMMARARALPLPDDHPFRASLNGLTERSERIEASLRQALPRSDAADAAARRVRRVLDATTSP